MNLDTLQRAKSELESEAARIASAIRAIDELIGALGGPVPRLSAALPTKASKRRRAKWTPAAREAARKRMKAYWAARRKG